MAVSTAAACASPFLTWLLQQVLALRSGEEGSELAVGWPEGSGGEVGTHASVVTHCDALISLVVKGELHRAKVLQQIKKLPCPTWESPLPGAYTTEWRPVWRR